MEESNKEHPVCVRDVKVADANRTASLWRVSTVSNVSSHGQDFTSLSVSLSVITEAQVIAGIIHQATTGKDTAD
jgi:hypothetical protein